MKLIRVSAVWCPACLIMRPRIDEMKAKFPHIEHIEYDYDLDEEIVNEYNIQDKLPVFILVDNDKEIGRLIGEKSAKEIENFLESSNI